MGQCLEIGKGIIAYTNGDERIKKYSVTVLLHTVYKIWETTISNILNQILNLLTEDNPRAHKTKRSEMGIIYFTIKQIPNKNINDYMLLDISKAFDRGDRRTHCWVLYAKVFAYR